MDFDQKNDGLKDNLERKTYVAPAIQISCITMESGFVAGSVVTISIEDNNTPVVTDWIERETEQTWNF